MQIQIVAVGDGLLIVIVPLSCCCGCYRVYLRGLAQLHELLRRPQQRQVRVRDDARQAAPLAQALRRRRLRVPLHAAQLLLAARADAQVAAVQVYQPR